MNLLDAFTSSDPIDFGELDRTDVFEVLANERRQIVIEYVSYHRDTKEFDINDFTLAVARCQAAGDAPYSGETRKRFYVALYQVHMDVLLDGKVLTEVRHNVYGRGPYFEEYARLLQSVKK